jgi:hypothetical protein
MHRRSLSSGRRLAALGAIVTLIGCLLPWYVLGGDGGLPELVYRAFDGTGMLTFLAALATLALVTLPYAAGERPLGIDHPMVFALLAVLALVGIVLWIPNIHALDAPDGLFPDRAYGYWISVVGSIILARAAYDIALEPRAR